MLRKLMSLLVSRPPLKVRMRRPFNFDGVYDPVMAAYEADCG